VNEWRQIVAATNVLDQMLKNQKSYVSNLQGLDLSFWKDSLLKLINDVKRLPKILRFNAVKLKRELKNPDYEHLWFELHELEFGQMRIPKFEFRLGAAMIQPSSFSRFPKLEIPLINGSTKPFDSWFAESYDDHGAKYELRFSLDKKAFDFGAWLKIAPQDQIFLQNVIYAMPIVLKQLIYNKVSINRPWGIWSAFLREMIDIFVSQIKLSQAKNASDSSHDPSMITNSLGNVAKVSPNTGSPEKNKAINVTVVKSSSAKHDALKKGTQFNSVKKKVVSKTVASKRVKPS
jgi:hypothetical protein